MMVNEMGRRLSEEFPKLEIDPEVGKKAMEFFITLREKGALENRFKIRGALASLYFEIRKYPLHSQHRLDFDPRGAENFCRFARNSFGKKYRSLPNQKTLRRFYRLIVNEQWPNFPELVKQICQNMKLNQKVSNGAVALAEKVKEGGIEPRRDPIFLAVGCVYIATDFLAKKIIQERLAIQFNTSPSTIGGAARYILAKVSPIFLLKQ